MKLCINHHAILWTAHGIATDQLEIMTTGGRNTLRL